MSAALETTLEWPRFCYTGPSLFDESTRKNSRKQKKSPGTIKRLSSGSSSKSVESDGETGSVQDEQMVPILREPISTVRNEFAFSDLMRKMASKYQTNTSDGATETTRSSTAERNPFMTEAFSAMLGHYLPYGQAPFLGAASPFFPPLPSLAPALETLAGSRALSALAQAQKRLRENDTTDSELRSCPNPAKKRRTGDDPLDLSSSSGSTVEDDVDVLSIDPPSPSNVEQWSVDKVAEFVSNVESCRDYAQVFLEHSIDGSALMVLTESHLTRILGMKLGHAIRLASAIQELKAITQHHVE